MVYIAVYRLKSLSCSWNKKSCSRTLLDQSFRNYIMKLDLIIYSKRVDLRGKCLKILKARAVIRSIDQMQRNFRAYYI